MVLTVEGVDLTEVMADWSDMVSNYVDHNPHIHGVGSFHKIRKRIIAAEVVVDFVPLAAVVAVVRAFSVVDNWRDPYSVESQILNILELVGDSLEVSATVLRKVATTCASVSLSVSVSQKLVN